MDKFEEIFREKAQEFELPYQEGSFASFENKLKSAKKASFIRKTSIAATVAFVGLFSAWLLLSDDKQLNDQNLSYNTEEAVIGSSKTVEPTSKQTAENINHSVELENKINTTEVEALEEEKELQERNIEKTAQPEKEKNTPTFTVVEKEENIRAEFIVYNNKVCLGEEVTFEAIEKNKNWEYEWYFGDGNSKKGLNAAHVYEEAGVYNVSLVIRSNNNKKQQSILANAVEIYDIPVAEFSYVEEAVENDKNKLKFPLVRFKAEGKEEFEYSWSFGKGNTSSNESPKLLYDKKGQYSVTLTATSQYGCSSSRTKTVEVKYPFDVFAPNAFSPNNDGKNDSFIPKALLGWDVKFEMVIKDKSGTIVYSTSDKNSGWNGRLNNREQTLPEDVYLWQVITYDAENKGYKHSGTVTLLR